jgi:hypothetical protein
MLHDIFSVVDSKYHNQIFNFVMTTGWTKETFGQDIKENIKSSEIELSIIGRKEESVEITLQKLKGLIIKDTYAVGDSVDDIDMMFAVQELGGNCGIIGDIETEDDVCYSSAANCYLKEVNSLYKKFRQEYGVMDYTLLRKDPRYIGIYRLIDEKAKEIESLIESGTISRESILRENFLIWLLSNHLMGHPEDELYSGIEKVKKFQVHPDFNSFYMANLRTK